MTDEQQTAEAIDPDELGDDPTGELEYPPDRPQGVTDPGRDDRVVDSVEDRARREQPERESTDPDRAGHLLAVGDVELDDEKDLVADIAEDDDPDDLSAEEAAVHIVD